MKEIGIHITTVLWIMAIVVFVVGIANRCLAQDDNETALALAQCLAAECDMCDHDPDERNSMVMVMRKLQLQFNANPRNKKQRSYRDQVLAYCALFDKRSYLYNHPRRVAIRSATLEHNSHLDDMTWRELVDYSRNVLSFGWDKVPDPTPTGMYFSGKCDINKAHQRGLVEVTRYCSDGGRWCTIIWRRQ
jgi:hypothetical protein